MREGVVVDAVPVVAHIGGDEKQQCRAGLVEIGDEVPNDAEAVAERCDHDPRRRLQPVEPLAAQVGDELVERLGPREVGRKVVKLPLAHDLVEAGARAEPPGECRERLERADRGGPYGDDAAVIGPQQFEGRQRDLEVLGVHRMVRGVALLDGQEGPCTDVERHLAECEALAAQALDQLGREVQAGRRRRHRPFDLRVDGLVARVVDLLALAVEVGRDRNASQQFEQLAEAERRRPLEADELFSPPLARAKGAQRMGAARVVEADLDGPLLPLLRVAHDAGPLARSDGRQRPFVVGRSVGLEAEDLDAGPGGLVHEDAGADHLRVVEDEQAAGRELFAEVAETTLGDRSAAVDEQLRAAALGERKFGDPLLGKVVGVVLYIDSMLHFFRILSAKLLQKSEMRKDIVIELSYKGFG